ncbi:MAG: MerR family transcriptional regulator [Oligoflexia bacterium]|nr:MerR family transcriptional regulator [Oligoflexia bacterium]
MYSIKNVSMMTGISVHTLRAWEKRYGVVNPERGDNGRRFYSEADVEKLELISFIVKAGEAIGQVQKLSLEELKVKADLLKDSVIKEIETRDFLIASTVLDSALRSGLKEIILHELQSVVLKVNKNTESIKRLMRQVILPFTKKVFELHQSKNADDRQLSQSLLTFLVHILKQVMGASVEAFQGSTEPQGKKVLIGTVGSNENEIDALICAINAYINGKEAVYVGQVLDQGTINVFSEQGNKFDLLLINQPEVPNTCTMLAKIIAGLFDDGKLEGDLAVFQREEFGKCFGQPWGYSFKTFPDLEQVEEYFAAS